jgi:integral membrane sensor domain MASE1
LALSVPLSRFTSRVGGGSAFYVRPRDYMDAIFPIIAVTAATFGGIVGWFSRGRFRPTILICTITPILVQALILSLLPLPHEGFGSEEKEATFLFVYYIIFPFLLLAVPCLIGGVLMSLVAYHMKHANRRADTHAPAPKYPVSESGLVQPWRRR